MRRIKVVHFRWMIEHYRAPVLRRLSTHPEIDFTVCAGDNTEIFPGERLASAKEVGKSEGIRWRETKCRWIRWPFKFKWQQGVVNVALREDIDVAIFTLSLHCPCTLLSWAICIIRGIPVVPWSVGVKKGEQRSKWFVRRLLYRQAKALLLYGQFARDFFIRCGFRKDKIFVVRNSLDHDVQMAIRQTLTDGDRIACRAEYGVRKSEERLIFISSRLEKPKKIGLLIRSIARLKKKGRGVHLVVIGDGRESEKLSLITQEQEVEDRVIFLGPCYDEYKLGRIIFSSDLCVVPGEVGLIAMHSLVYGTPILTCNNRRGSHGPEIESVVEGLTGSYFRDGDLQDLVEKMEEMLYIVPCRSRMSEACRKMIDTTYTPEYQERIIINSLNYCLPAHKQIPMPDQ